MVRYTRVDPKDVIKLTCKGFEIHVIHKDAGMIAVCSDVTIKMLCRYLEWAKEGIVHFYGWLDEEKENS